MIIEYIYLGTLISKDNRVQFIYMGTLISNDNRVQ